MTHSFFMGIFCLVFGIGLFGFLTNVGSIIAYVISLEIMFLALNMIFVTISSLIDVQGDGFVVLILAVTAAEVALLLGIIVLHYRRHGTIDARSIEEIRE